MKLVIATRNAHKTQEIAQILPQEYQVCSLAAYPDAPEIEEDGTTFAANAKLKAVGISQCIAGLILADDSGLCVDALAGEPGIYSARYAGEHGHDQANNAYLLDKLRALPAEQAPFTARFVCAMSLAQDGVELAAFEGHVEGHITLTPSGEQGFGYDPLFIPHGYDLSFGELPADVKNAISHRSNALNLLREKLATLTRSNG